MARLSRRLAAMVGPAGPRERRFSARRAFEAFVRCLLQFIRIVRRNRDPAFAQQPRQQAHRHLDDVVIRPADRCDQAPALALYSVGTSLILRFTRSYVATDFSGRKFTPRAI